MSLIEEYSVTAKRLIPTYTEDGEGGKSTVWTEGEEFICCITFDDSVYARKAAKDGVTDNYTITTGKNTELKYGDVFKAENVVYRVTSNGYRNETPASASINMRQVRAERWMLP